MDKIRHDQDVAGEDKQSLRHCMYGLDADLMMLGRRTTMRENTLRKTTRKDTNKDIDPRDVEILEVSMLRRMLKLHIEDSIKNYLDQQPTICRKSFSELLGIDRVIDDFVFM